MMATQCRAGPRPGAEQWYRCGGIPSAEGNCEHDNTYASIRYEHVNRQKRTWRQNDEGKRRISFETTLSRPKARK